MIKKLDWKNLKDEYCPHCYEELEEQPGEYHCTACKFRITKARYNEIFEDMVKEEAGNNAENA
jgi:hypothetical protein